MSDLNPWGVATGSEWQSQFPLFNPPLEKAGVRWLRAFNEWQSIEPKQGYWNWTQTDRLVTNAKSHGLNLVWVLAYLAPWASADGGTRKFPMKDPKYWSSYVSKLIERYHDDIKYWEVWNEFNGSFSENGNPQIYAGLVRDASIAAKAIDPSAKIGMSVANFDIRFLDAAIKAGAAGHFDFICVHPYEKLEALANNGEVDFLAMASTLRGMLEANGQPANIPLWITEIGAPAPARPEPARDRQQAIALAKAYLLSIASGFQRIFWFEARGPAYGSSGDHGLLRADFSPRPSYDALATLSKVLGPAPGSDGWLDLGENVFNFAFRRGDQSVLAVWSNNKRQAEIAFSGDVKVYELTGRQTDLKSGQKLTLTESPILIADLPAALAQQARANKGKNYPWSSGVAAASAASGATIDLRAANVEKGIRQINQQTTATVISGDQSWRRTDFTVRGDEGHYVYFSVDPQLVPADASNLEISATVKRLAPDKLAGMNLNYESRGGYVTSGYLSISEQNDWQKLVWKLTDANFVGQWGWNFRLNAIGSPNEFMIKEVTVKRIKPN